MWGLLSLVRRGLLRRRRRRSTARVVDESALGGCGGVVAGVDVLPAVGDARAAAPSGASSALARALIMAMACGAVRLDGEDGGGGAEEAWTASGWRPRADEVSLSHLMVRESMRYAIYA